MKTVLVIGSKGMLGKTLTKYLREQRYVVLEHRSSREVFVEPIDSNLSYVVNCSGIIPQRHSPGEIARYIKGNTVNPQLWAMEYHRRGIPFIHITSDCVYADEFTEHDENAIITARDIYGVSKALGESPLACNIRTSIIGEGDYGIGLLEWVRSLKKGDTVQGFANHLWNGVTTLQLSKKIEQMIRDHCLWTGTRHYYSHPMSKYDLVMSIADVYNIDANILRHETEYPCQRILSSIYPNMFCETSIYEQLRELRSVFKK